jgi:hypothetical protein
VFSKEKLQCFIPGKVGGRRAAGSPGVIQPQGNGEQYQPDDAMKYCSIPSGNFAGQQGKKDNGALNEVDT